MFGLGYISQQVFSFTDLDKLNEALKYNQIGEYEIDNFSKLIKYKINRKQCIRLDDLFQWIVIKAIKLHIGQLLDLIQNLLNYAKQMTLNGIEHTKVKDNRIYLILKQESEAPTIINFRFAYNIVSTGFQCPFYEQAQDTQMDLSDKIQQILQEFMTKLQKEKIVLIDEQNEFDKINKEIYRPLQNKFYQMNLQKTIDFVQSLKKSLNYDIILQRIQYDDKHLSNQSKQHEIKGILNQVYKYYGEKENSQWILESALYVLLPNLVKSDQKFNLNAITEDYYKKQIKIYEQQEIKLDQDAKQQIKSVLEKQIKESKEYFKFNYSEEQKSKQEQEILQAFKANSVTNYFRNSFQSYLNEELVTQMINIQKNQIEEYVVESVQLMIQIQILQLIQDLI